jgi:hypothetical protein
MSNDSCELDVTGDTTLTSDVACTIVVMAQNATLNLNHHTASGGIYGTDATTVRNGRVTSGIWVGGHSTIEQVTAVGASDSADAPALQVGFDSVIRYNRFVGNTVAIDLYYGGDQSVVVHNTFDGNETAIWNDRSSNVVIADNTFVRNSVGVGMNDEDEYAGEVYHNTITANVFRNNMLGVAAGAFVGVRSLTIDHNEFKNNKAAGVQVEIFCRVNCGGAHMQVFANTFTHNGYTPGTSANSGFSATSEHNGNPTTRGNRHVTLSDNTAVQNAGLGIDAVNAVDGGGNVAHGNGNPAQCAGVVCTAVPPPA